MKKYKKIYIEITNNCNLNCSFCSKVEKPRRNMTIEELMKTYGIEVDYKESTSSIKIKNTFKLADIIFLLLY